MKVGVVSRLSADGDGALAKDWAFLRAGQARVIVCTSAATEQASVEQLRAHGVEVLVRGGERVDLAASMAALSELGVERLMVEGGEYARRRAVGGGPGR